MTKRSFLATILALAVMLCEPAAAPVGIAYQADPSLQGVTVSGIVTLIGSTPRAKPLPVHRDGAVCGATVPDESVMVDPESRGIANVIVSLEGVTRGKPLPENSSILIENLTCRFHHRANAAVVGSVVHIKNSDPILHNTHIRKGSRFGDTVINVAQPVGAPIIEKHLDEVGLLDVRCDAHTFMRASLHVFEHPYFTVTDQTGRFTLTQVPAGTYRLKLWHEVLGAQAQEVTVPPSGELSLELEMERPR